MRHLLVTLVFSVSCLPFAGCSSGFGGNSKPQIEIVKKSLPVIEAVSDYKVSVSSSGKPVQNFTAALVHHVDLSSSDVDRLLSDWPKNPAVLADPALDGDGKVYGIAVRKVLTPAFGLGPGDVLTAALGWPRYPSGNMEAKSRTGAQVGAFAIRDRPSVRFQERHIILIRDDEYNEGGPEKADRVALLKRERVERPWRRHIIGLHSKPRTHAGLERRPDTNLESVAPHLCGVLRRGAEESA